MRITSEIQHTTGEAERSLLVRDVYSPSKLIALSVVNLPENLPIFAIRVHTKPCGLINVSNDPWEECRNEDQPTCRLMPYGFADSLNLNLSPSPSLNDING